MWLISHEIHEIHEKTKNRLTANYANLHEFLNAIFVFAECLSVYCFIKFLLINFVFVCVFCG
jgi:hypothetical protein